MTKERLERLPVREIDGPRSKLVAARRSAKSITGVASEPRHGGAAMFAICIVRRVFGEIDGLLRIFRR